MGLGRQLTEFLSTGHHEFASSGATRRNLAEKYRAVMAAIPVGYFETDATGKVIFCNQALCDTVGRPMQELIGSEYRDLLDERGA